MGDRQNQMELTLRLTDRLELASIADIPGPETRTKRLLIAAGERLFGHRGLEGAAMHEIALEAGQANKYAVQYHFGDKQGFIDAILAIRLRQIDQRRQALLDIVIENGLTDDVSALMEIMYIPLAEQVDETGQHSYARFLLQFITNIEYNASLRHPLMDWDPANPAIRTAELLAAKLGLTREAVRHRLAIQSFVMLASLLDRDNAVRQGQEVFSLTQLVAAIVRAISTAISLPALSYERAD